MEMMRGGGGEKKRSNLQIEYSFWVAKGVEGGNGNRDEAVDLILVCVSSQQN